MNKKIIAKISQTASFIVCIVMIFSSCSTTRKQNQKANIPFLIIDENDQPVKDYQITITVPRKIGDDFTQTCFSNSNGLCVFYDINFEEAQIAGQKSGFTKILPEPLSQKSRSELLCHRVSSADYLFDQAEQFYQNKQYEKSLELLESLCTQNDLVLQNIVCFYSACNYIKLDQKEKAGLELQKMRELENPAFETSQYCEAIEKMLALMNAPD